MGVYLHLIDVRSPRGFTVVVPEGSRSAYQRMPLVQTTDTMADVVADIMRRYGRRRYPLDVIRMEAHGVVGRGSAVVNQIQLGTGLTVSSARAFREIRSLWSRTYEPDDRDLWYRSVIPRIEMHVCEVIPGCVLTLRALAEEARAPVFASSASQDVDARPGFDAFAMEGRIRRFNPSGVSSDSPA
jgi:hypothetical protein